MSSDEGFYAKMITLCGNCGMLDHAQKLFDEMPKRGLWSFNALLGAYLHSKRFDDANRLFKELPGKLCIKPDRFSYGIVFKALCEIGYFDLVNMMLCQMVKKGMELNSFTYNILLHAFCKNGKFEDVEELWNIMLEKNLVPNIRGYNARLLGLVEDQKRLYEAVHLDGEMRSKGVRPDAISYNVLISGFFGEENLEGGKRCYNKMRKNNCVPNAMTFQLLLPFVCEKGDADFAFELSVIIFGRRFSRNRTTPFDESSLQKVVNELVKCSNVEKARKLVQLGEENQYHNYRLTLPWE